MVAAWSLWQKRVSISTAVKDPGKPMPHHHLVHILLQIITVAMGSPLGREVAPREAGPSLQAACTLLRLTPADIQLMIACGAGAGLAAVYNVPLAGAFTLEVLLVSFSWDAAIAALVTSALAAWMPPWGLAMNISIASPPNLPRPRWFSGARCPAR
jgi:H+/Cl- antiporter ClcA